MKHDTPDNSAAPAPGRPLRSYIDREHPIGGEMSDIVRGILTRARLPWLLQLDGDD